MSEIVINEKVIIEEKFEVKLCPFCGSEDVELQSAEGQYGYSYAYAYCKCLQCGATSGECKEEYLSKRLKLRAINSWNRRASK